MPLFFDVETTGQALHKEPATDPRQPRIVQLAAVLTDDALVERCSVSLLVNPFIPIPAEVTEIHGISDEDVKNYGVSNLAAMTVLVSMMKRARLVVAHNLDFDILVARSGMWRAYCTDLPVVEQFCTMKAMVTHCKLPGYRGDFKWPKLQEAHVHCFGMEFAGDHDALNDVRACIRIFKWLQEQKTT